MYNDETLLPVSKAIILCTVLTVCAGREGYLDWNQEYGYLLVRPGAYMFFWLFYVNNISTINEATQFPLVMWLQGGPGSGSTGLGNFLEIGPYYRNGTKRDTAWTKYANVLFVDNPVGSGYSFVTSDDLYTKNNSEIASDLVTFTKRFLSRFCSFQKTPLYIFSQSYGGKMAIEFTMKLHEAISSKQVQANLQAVALGDSFISPIDSILTWAPYLLNLGILDIRNYRKVDEAAQLVKAALDIGEYSKATSLWFKVEAVVLRYSFGVNFYNVLHYGYDPDNPAEIHTEELSAELVSEASAKPDSESPLTLHEFMNGEVKRALKIPDHVVWGGQSDDVFTNLWDDFMKPVTDIVEQVLNETDVGVIVYNGHLDLIVDIVGTMNWVERIIWTDVEGWKSAPRYKFTVNDTMHGRFKFYKNFSVYWIFNAGHLVPKDNGIAALEMLRDIIERRRSSNTS